MIGFSGLIDFYFACNDAFAYDLDICLNAWCFEADGAFNVSKGMAMINGYERLRPLKAEEIKALPILARGSALRFMLTRLVDWLDVPPGAKVVPKNPLEYLVKLRFHQRVVSARDYGLLGDGARHDLDRRRLLGNPGPGGWGAILRYGGHKKEFCGGEAPTTNNRMELTAAIAALEALSRPCRVELHTNSQYLRGGVTAWMPTGNATAGAPPTRSRSRTKTSGAASTPPPSVTKSTGAGSRATPATK